MDIKSILSMDTEDLCVWVQNNFTVKQMTDITGIEDMKEAARLNFELSSYETYFSNLLSYAEVLTRQAKREYSKIEYENMVDRKKIIANKHESLKHQREALSRSVTIYTKMLDEIKYSERY